MSRVCVVSSRTDIVERVREQVAAGVLPPHDYQFVIEYFNELLPASEASVFRVKDFAESRDVLAILDWARRQGVLDHIVSADEFAVYIAAQIRDALGVRGLSAEEARRYRDKAVMHATLVGSCVRMPKSYALPPSHSDAIEFPVVVKPRSLAGAVGVEIIESWQELYRHLASATVDGAYIDMSKDQRICQEYIPHPLYHVDFIIQKGAIVFAAVSRYTHTPKDYFLGQPLFSRVILDFPLPVVWLRFLGDVNAAFRLDSGVYHLEAFQAFGEEPIFLEIGYRPGGALIVPLFKELYGLDLLALHLALQMDESVAFEVNKRHPCGGWVIFPKDHISNQPARVQSVRMPYTPFQSRLVHARVPLLGEAASGEFFSHEDCLGGFAFVGESVQIDHDMAVLCDEYKVNTALDGYFCDTFD